MVPAVVPLGKALRSVSSCIIVYNANAM
uniref:Uncharacterized protein n=1 Tax=Anguilla anguilla TaxID=7936 RepID=A0A0E9U5Z8_ANGAN